MNQDHHTPHDPLRNEPPGLGPAVERTNLGQDFSGMRTQTWQPQTRKRAKWPLWLGGLAIVGVAAAMMLDMKPGEQWVSAHLDRPAPESESVPLPLPSQPAPQAQTELPAMPAATPADEPAPKADRDTTPPAAATAKPEPRSDTARTRAEPSNRRDRPVDGGALEPRAESPAIPAAPAAVTPAPVPVPEPSVTPTPTPSEPAPVPADPKPQPVDPAAPSGS